MLLKKVVTCFLFSLSIAHAQTCPYLFCSGFEKSEKEGIYVDDIPLSDAEAAKFLTQATFGPTYSSIERLRKLGYTKWIDEQQRVSASELLPALDALIVERRDNPIWHTDLQGIWFNDILFNDDQLRQRVAFALSQIFVVSSNADLGPAALATYYDILIDEAFGHYRDLLERVTLNPAMGRYLSMAKNRKPGLGKVNMNAREDLRDDARPDENYAREIMQLFSVGLVMLNQDGTVIDGNKNKPGVQAIPTYTQETIKGFAHVFTGWNSGSCKPPEANKWYQPGSKRTPFIAWHWDWCPEIDDKPNNEKQHKKIAKSWRLPMKPWGEGSKYGDAYHASAGTKQLLKYKGVALKNGILPAGGSARSNMKKALDNVFHHPNVPPFIAFRLIQRLTTSNPTPAYVKRVADKFVNNGKGVRGDIAAVVKAILLDPEARNPKHAPAHFGKIREPIIRVANLYRAFNGDSRKGGFYETWLVKHSDQMVLNAPSVFNYYLPEYSHAGIVQRLGLYSPELQMMTDSHLSKQARYLEQKIYWLSHLGVMDDKQGDTLLQLDYIGLLRYIDDPDRLVEEIDLLLTFGTMPSKQKQRYISMMNQDKYSKKQSYHTEKQLYNMKKDRISNIITLTISSPAFIVEAHK